MSVLGEVFLGIIALATLTTAILELVVIVWLVHTARRTVQRVEGLSRQVSPILAHAAAIGDQLSRVRSLASAQLDRAAATRLAIAGPVRQLATALAVARGAAGALGWALRRSRHKSTGL